MTSLDFWTEDAGGEEDRPSAGSCAVVWLVGSLCLAGAVGCDESGDEGPVPQTDDRRAEADVEAAPDADSSPETAYGLPLPPSTDLVRRYDGAVEVETAMTVDELANFYRRELVDYEILRPANWKLRIVGLREFTPSVRGHAYGSIVYLTYLPRRRRPVPARADSDAGASASGDSRGPRRGGGGDETDGVAGRAGGEETSRAGGSEPYEEGAPVELKTPEGELLAPGARWGEPYTPPEGSPLDKPRYRSNFGRPFGEWRAP